MGLKRNRWTEVNWINLLQNGNKWHAVVTAIMNLPSSIKCGKFLD